jgi:hypothetical protein
VVLGVAVLEVMEPLYEMGYEMGCQTIRSLGGGWGRGNFLKRDQCSFLKILFSLCFKELDTVSDAQDKTLPR